MEVYSVGRSKYDKLRGRVITGTESVQGGWKPNMWGTYPQHETGKARQMPAIDWMLEARERRPELADRKKTHDEFKPKIDVEKHDKSGQSMMT